MGRRLCWAAMPAPAKLSYPPGFWPRWRPPASAGPWWPQPTRPWVCCAPSWPWRAFPPPGIPPPSTGCCASSCAARGTWSAARKPSRPQWPSSTWAWCWWMRPRWLTAACWKLPCAAPTPSAPGWCSWAIRPSCRRWASPRVRCSAWAGPAGPNCNRWCATRGRCCAWPPGCARGTCPAAGQRRWRRSAPRPARWPCWSGAPGWKPPRPPCAAAPKPTTPTWRGSSATPTAASSSWCRSPAAPCTARWPTSCRCCPARC